MTTFTKIISRDVPASPRAAYRTRIAIQLHSAVVDVAGFGGASATDGMGSPPGWSP